MPAKRTAKRPARKRATRASGAPDPAADHTGGGAETRSDDASRPQGATDDTEGPRRPARKRAARKPRTSDAATPQTPAAGDDTASTAIAFSDGHAVFEGRTQPDGQQDASEQSSPTERPAHRPVSDPFAVPEPLAESSHQSESHQSESHQSESHQSESHQSESHQPESHQPESQAPSDDDTGDDETRQDDSGQDEHDGGGSRRRRRRRGGRRRRRGGQSHDGDDQDASDDASDDEDRHEEDDTQSGSGGDNHAERGSAGPTRRRRRRRRRGEDAGSAEDDPSDVVVKVREPRSSRNSEITGIEGSTRVEAKRQRRRAGRESGRRRSPILSEAEFLARRESVRRSMIIRQRPSSPGLPDLTQIAVLEDGVLVEHYVDQDSGQSLIGNVYLGRIQNVLPSMEAAFIDIGKGRNAVLYAGEVDWDSFGASGESKKVEQVLKSGQSILVQVTKDPIGAKGARLTNHISLPGRYIVYSPGGQLSGISRKLSATERKRLKDVLSGLVEDSASVIVRTAAEGASEEELVRDVDRLKAQWRDIEKLVKSGGAPKLLYAEPDLTVRIVRDLFTEDFAELLIDGNGSTGDAYDTIEAYVRHVAPHLGDRMKRWPTRTEPAPSEDEAPEPATTPQEASSPDDDRDAEEQAEDSAPAPEEDAPVKKVTPADLAKAGKPDIFAAYRIDEQIAKALERKVHLPSGGSLIIDRTEAMTVIDVNTGKFTGSAGNLEATVTSNNLEAAEEIVRQLRLRDLGGIIVIDFIDMVLPANRELLLRRLVECLGRDRTRHQVTEVTSLGLVQMTRKRIGTGLLEAFSTECEHCHGRGVELHDVPVHHQPDEDRDNRRGRGRRGGRNGKDGQRQDSGKGDSGKNDSGKNDSGKNDSGKNDSGKNGKSGRHDSGKQGSGADDSDAAGRGADQEPAVVR